MSDDNASKNIGLTAYFTGMLHAELFMIRNDLHMGDTKSALAKVNDAIKLIDEKIGELYYGVNKDGESKPECVL